MLAVQFALVAPHRLDAYHPPAFARIPVEALAAGVLVLVLPPRWRRVLGVGGGAVLGVLALLKLLDLGFDAVLVRPFDPSRDAALFGNARDYLVSTLGGGAAAAVTVAAVLIVVAVPVVMVLAVRRLTGLVLRHDRAATRAVAALTVAWLACAAFGAQVGRDAPIAAHAGLTDGYDRAVQVRTGLHDRAVFAAQARVDAFAGVPGDRLLTGLRGKDVVLAFVESYGRSAIADPRIAPQVLPVLADGGRRLTAAGFSARSAFLTSSTAGGGSWFAHSTLMSGLKIDDGSRYRPLMISDRLTLDVAFHRAGWRTVGVMPGVTRTWPEARLYGYDQLDDLEHLNYRGATFGWSPAPDQYVLSVLQRSVLATSPRPPVMVDIALTSSHAPWTPVPRTVPWDRAGDAAAYGPVTGSEHRSGGWPDPALVRADYAASLRYSLDTLISWTRTYGDDDLVLVFLGDHQPLPIVTGPDAGRDVPVTIVARDPAVLDRIAGWGWQDGLAPGPQAPVWPMQDFRDRFLTAFGPDGGTAARPSPAAPPSPTRTSS